MSKIIQLNFENSLKRFKFEQNFNITEVFRLTDVT
jgi:hypothetical protein